MRFHLLQILLGLIPALASATDFACSDKATGAETARISISATGEKANVRYKNIIFQDVKITSVDDLEIQGFSLNRFNGQEKLKLALFKKLPANDPRPDSFRGLVIVATNVLNSWSPLSESNVDLVCWQSKAWNEQ